MKRLTMVAALVTFLGLTVLLPANEVTFESSTSRVHLLELFTSEGCSSCPPAEKWLSALTNHPGLWRDFVPMAFHVDYWDQLGWRDPFASKRWTIRQYDYSASWHRGGVYTPGFVLDGQESSNSHPPTASSEKAGVLKITALDDGKIKASFTPVAGGNEAFEIHVARLGFGLTVAVRSGENSGRELLHDFIVLALETAKMNDGKVELPSPSQADRQRAGTREALVAWVTRPAQIEPIQAVGGWIR